MPPQNQICSTDYTLSTMQKLNVKCLINHLSLSHYPNGSRTATFNSKLVHKEQIKQPKLQISNVLLAYTQGLPFENERQLKN